MSMTEAKFVLGVISMCASFVAAILLGMLLVQQMLGWWRCWEPKILILCVDREGQGSGDALTMNQPTSLFCVTDGVAAMILP